MGQASNGSTFQWVNVPSTELSILWVNFPMGQHSMGQCSFSMGQDSVRSTFQWVYLPWVNFPGSTFQWVNLPSTKKTNFNMIEISNREIHGNYSKIEILGNFNYVIFNKL